MIIFFHFSPTSNRNCRLVVDEDDNGKFRPERVNLIILPCWMIIFSLFLFNYHMNL